MTNVATVSVTGCPNNVSLVNIVSRVEHSIMVLSLKLKTPSEVSEYLYGRLQSGHSFMNNSMGTGDLSFKSNQPVL